MHRGREAVVRRLAHVDVIVRVHRRLGARLGAEQLVRARGNHLVDVHVGLGTRSGLPHGKRKVVVELAVDDLLRRAHDRLAAPGIERAERVVHLGGRALDDAERMDERDRHAFVADTEIAP
jgi:hypothetical protein